MHLETRVLRALLIVLARQGRERRGRHAAAVIRRKAPHLLDEAVAVFARHRDVAQDHLRTKVRRGSEPRRGRWRRADLGAELFQHRRERGAGVLRVLDEEHADAGDVARDAPRPPSDPALAAPIGRVTRNVAPIALARALRVNLAAVGLDQVAHDREPQPEAAVGPRDRAVGLDERSRRDAAVVRRESRSRCP